MAEEQRRTLTVRLPAGLYDAATDLAKRRGVSLNHLVQEGLTAVIQGEEYGRLYDAFGLLADDPSPQEPAGREARDAAK